jgi:TetR/AcrR family transcriptional regulator
MKTRKQPSRLPTDERRAVTVQAVIDLAARTNPAEITTGAIADCMQITQGALFRHFPTKDAIWEGVMAWVAGHLLGRLDAAAAAAGSPTDALEAIFRAHVDFAVRLPGVPRILFSELQRPGATPAKHTAQKIMAQYAERLTVLIDAGKAVGELAAEINNQDAVALFIGSIQGLIIQALLAGNVKQMRTQADGVFALYLRGIRKTA